MSYENVAMSDRAFGWDDEIKNDGPDFVLRPEGDYLFTVTGFERARYEGGAKLVLPRPMAKLTIRIHGGDKGETSVTTPPVPALPPAARGCSARSLRASASANTANRCARAGMNWSVRRAWPTWVCGSTPNRAVPTPGQTGQANEITRFLPPPEPTAAPQQPWAQGAF